MTKVVGIRNAAVSNNPKHRVGLTKAPLSLVPRSAKIHLAMALADGAEKYGAYNWRIEAVNMRIYLEAAERHLDALLDGEDKADDSGLHHAAHIMACMAIILDAQAQGKLIDDRPVEGAAARLLVEAKEWLAERTKKPEPTAYQRAEAACRGLDDAFTRNAAHDSAIR